MFCFFVSSASVKERNGCLNALIFVVAIQCLLLFMYTMNISKSPHLPLPD